MSELASALRAGPRPDYVTLAGSGEPTLFRPLDELIAGIKALTDVPVAVLTNGSLLWQREIRQELAEADLVVPSLDAASAAQFRRTNRPHPAISFETMVRGLIEFAEHFHGRLWLEVLLLAGLSARPKHVRELAAIAEQIKPERIQLNTVTRPPAEKWATAASPDELRAAAAILGGRGEVVADYQPTATGEAGAANEQAVLQLLLRRPCRLQDVANGLGLHRNEAVKYLEHLARAGAIVVDAVSAEPYYRIAREDRAASGERWRK